MVHRISRFSPLSSCRSIFAACSCQEPKSPTNTIVSNGFSLFAGMSNAILDGTNLCKRILVGDELECRPSRGDTPMVCGLWPIAYMAVVYTASCLHDRSSKLPIIFIADGPEDPWPMAAQEYDHCLELWPIKATHGVFGKCLAAPSPSLSKRGS